MAKSMTWGLGSSSRVLGLGSRNFRTVNAHRCETPSTYRITSFLEDQSSADYELAHVTASRLAVPSDEVGENFDIPAFLGYKRLFFCKNRNVKVIYLVFTLYSNFSLGDTFNEVGLHVIFCQFNHTMCISLPTAILKDNIDIINF